MAELVVVVVMAVVVVVVAELVVVVVVAAVLVGNCLLSSLALKAVLVPPRKPATMVKPRVSLAKMGHNGYKSLGPENNRVGLQKGLALQGWL